jgi:ribose transport system ATP-binding protein
VLVMDEPSAVLDGHEVETMFAVVRRLAGEGVGVVYISHRLEEIAAVGDTITVLRDGRTVATGLPPDTPRAELIAAMVGRRLDDVFPGRDPAHELGPEVLRVDGLTRRPAVESVSFAVREGEIVGLGGLVGAGRTELLRLIAGVDRPDAGTVAVGGHRLPSGRADVAIRAGVGLAPEERKSQALLLGESVYRNVSLSALTRFARGGFMREDAEREAAQTQTARLDVRPADVKRAARTLSGGNQQKVVLARWLLQGCSVLLLDEPTRGVDVGARSEIYAVIRELAASGVAIVVVSSEVPEVLGLADRVLVIREGRVVHTAPAGELDEGRVLDLVMEGAHV